MLYDLESHAIDGRCGLSRNEDIRRYVGKLVEKQTLDYDLLYERSSRYGNQKTTPSTNPSVEVDVHNTPVA